MGQIHNIYIFYIQCICNYICHSRFKIFDDFGQNAAKERKTTEGICETTVNAILLCTNFHKGSQLPEESLRDGFRVPFPSVPPTCRRPGRPWCPLLILAKQGPMPKDISMIEKFEATARRL